MTPGVLDDLLVSILQTPDWSKLVYFQSGIDVTNYQHLKGEMQSMTAEKIAVLIANKKIKPQYTLLLKYNAVTYFVYYNKGMDCLIINNI